MSPVSNNKAAETAAKLAKAFDTEASVSALNQPTKITPAPSTESSAKPKKAVAASSAPKAKPKAKLKKRSKPKIKAIPKVQEQTQQRTQSKQSSFNASESFGKASEVFNNASKELLGLAKQNFEQNLKAAKDTMEARDLRQLFSIQTKLFEQNLQNCMKQTQKLNELYLQSFKKK